MLTEAPNHLARCAFTFLPLKNSEIKKNSVSGGVLQIRQGGESLRRTGPKAHQTSSALTNISTRTDRTAGSAVAHTATGNPGENSSFITCFAERIIDSFQCITFCVEDASAPD